MSVILSRLSLTHVESAPPAWPLIGQARFSPAIPTSNFFSVTSALQPRGC